MGQGLDAWVSALDCGRTPFTAQGLERGFL